MCPQKFKDESSAILRKEFVKPLEDSSTSENASNSYLTESVELVKELYKNLKMKKTYIVV